MPNNAPIYYWDSCVFLSYIEGTPGRVGVIEDLLSDAEADRVRIYTSTVTITEVAFHQSERIEKTLDPTIEHAIAGLWAAPSPIRVMEFHRLIGEDARKLMRWGLPHGLSLKALDAIHLASAQRLGAHRVQTYDKKWSAYASAIGSVVEEPVSMTPNLFAALDFPSAEQPASAEESDAE